MRCKRCDSWEPPNTRKKRGKQYTIPLRRQTSKEGRGTDPGDFWRTSPKGAAKPAGKHKNVPPPRASKYDPKLRANNSERRKLHGDNGSPANECERRYVTAY